MSYFTGKTDFAPGQVTSSDFNNITINLRLSDDSADGSTITVTAGVLSVGVLDSANYGADSIPTSAYAPNSVDNDALADDAVDTPQLADEAVEEAIIAAGAVAWTKTKSADRAVQADMQSETASHFVSPDVMKYHPGVSKAGGVLTMSDGTIAGGYNISGSATGSATSRTVTLGVTMANTNYRVQFSNEDSGTLANAPVVTAKTTTTFTVNSGGTKVAFDVFGPLA